MFLHRLLFVSECCWLGGPRLNGNLQTKAKLNVLDFFFFHLDQCIVIFGMYFDPSDICTPYLEISVSDLYQNNGNRLLHIGCYQCLDYLNYFDIKQRG